MRILISGYGLIGCYTAKELTERGDEVTFFDLQPNLDYLQKVLGRELPMIRGDIRELPALIEAMQRTRAEVVIHTDGLQGNRTPYFGFQVNLIGTLNVAEASRLTGVRRLQKILGDVRFMREQASRPRPALDISRARDDLGYEPKFDVEAGLRDFIAEIKLS